MKLTVATIENAAPRVRPYKLADGAGLTLLVMPHGRKLWRFRYRWQGREKMISLGGYPDTGLKLARDKRDAVRRQLAAGADPSEKRKAEKLAWANTFGDAGSEYVNSRRKRQAKRTTEKQEWLLRELCSAKISEHH